MLSISFTIHICVPNNSWYICISALYLSCERPEISSVRYTNMNVIVYKVTNKKRNTHCFLHFLNDFYRRRKLFVVPPLKKIYLSKKSIGVVPNENKGLGNLKNVRTFFLKLKSLLHRIFTFQITFIICILHH